MVRESLSNVARHARATTSEVIVAVTASHVTVVVDDDGIGMPENPERVSGTANLEMRARAHGGTCTVAARDLGGTRVHWRAPPRGGDDGLPMIGVFLVDDHSVVRRGSRRSSTRSRGSRWSENPAPCAVRSGGWRRLRRMSSCSTCGSRTAAAWTSAGASDRRTPGFDASCSRPSTTTRRAPPR